MDMPEETTVNKSSILSSIYLFIYLEDWKAALRGLHLRH